MTMDLLWSKNVNIKPTSEEITMSEKQIQEQTIEELYSEAHEHTINVGDVKIHAKRMGGKFRNLKWLNPCAAAVATVILRNSRRPSLLSAIFLSFPRQRSADFFWLGLYNNAQLRLTEFIVLHVLL